MKKIYIYHHLCQEVESTKPLCVFLVISLPTFFFLLPLEQWFSKCGPQTSSINTNWEPGENADPHAPAQTN